MFKTGSVVDLHAPSDTGSTMLGTDDIGDADAYLLHSSSGPIIEAPNIDSLSF